MGDPDRERAARLAALEALGAPAETREALVPALDELARALAALEAFAGSDVAPALTFDPRWHDDS